MDPQMINVFDILKKKYKLVPTYFEPFGNVIKVYSNRGIFAVKRVKFTNKQRQAFLHIMMHLHQKGYKHVVPIYPNIDGAYLTQDEDWDMYVMPWIDHVQGNKEQHDEQIMVQIANIHRITTYTIEANATSYQNFYDKTYSIIDKRKLDYEKFIDSCEKKIYMSPFELLYCTYFVSFMKSEDEALTQLENWYENMKDTKEDRLVICHGNLTPKHLLKDRTGHYYFINFDRAFIASPIYDVLYFFRSFLYFYPDQLKNAVHVFSQYNRHYPLTENELLLLTIYLLQSNKVHTLIQQYQQQQYVSEKKMVEKMQRCIWQMQAIHAFIEQMNASSSEQKQNN